MFVIWPFFLDWLKSCLNNRIQKEYVIRIDNGCSTRSDLCYSSVCKNLLTPLQHSLGRSLVGSSAPCGGSSLWSWSPRTPPTWPPSSPWSAWWRPSTRPRTWPRRPRCSTALFTTDLLGTSSGLVIFTMTSLLLYHIGLYLCILFYRPYWTLQWIYPYFTILNSTNVFSLTVPIELCHDFIVTLLY